MLVVRSLAPFALWVLLFSCSGLRLDTEKNCLNEKTPCFRPDKTAPQFQSSSPDNTQTYTVLDFIDITFSEEVKNGEDTGAYFLPTTGGAANGLRIQAAQKISQYTYRIFLGGASITTGDIDVHFFNIKDYNGNPLTGPTFVRYMGSANIPITLSVTYLGTAVTGVSNNGGGAFGNVDISFSHQFTADNANNYEIFRTDGATTCAGTSWATGTNLAPNVTIPSFNKLATDFPNPVHRIVVCVTNQNNPTAVGTASWLIHRDDTPPNVTYSIEPDNYPTPQTIALTCNDVNPDRIAYTALSQQTTIPGLPVAPGFDAVGAINPTSNLYTGPITAANPANPTNTRFRWQCIDKAGNRSDILTPTDYLYYIDNTIPAVNLVNDTTFRAYIGPVNTATTIKFTSDQASRTYNVMRGGTNCNGGGNGTPLGPGSGTTPATPGDVVSVPLNLSDFPPGDAEHKIRICVAGPTSVWGTAFLKITTDSTVPFIAPTVPAGTYSAVQSVTFQCTDTNLDKAAYRVSSQLGNNTPPAPTAPTFDAATGTITSPTTLTGPYLTPDSSRTIVAYGCIDRAGNQATSSTAQYTVDATIPAVTFISANHSGVTTNASGYTSVDIVWNTTKAGVGYSSGSNFEIRTTDCSGTILASGLSNATAGANNVTNIAASLFPAGANALKICVRNYVGGIGYQTSALNITRDDVLPTFAGISNLTNPNDGTVTLAWSAASDASSGIGGYDICQSTIASPGAGSCSAAFTATYQAPAGATGHTITGLTPATTYYFMVRARDNAGNRETNVIERRSRVTLSVTVTGYASAVPDFRISQAGNVLGFSGNGTQSFPIVFLPNDSYSISIVNQPGGQVCSFVQNQYGTITNDTTLNVTCVSGYLTSGAMTVNPAQPLNYLLYRGNATIIAGGGTGTPCTGTNTAACANGTGTGTRYNNPHGMTIVNGNIYIADRANHRIRRYAISTGVTSTFAGEGTQASVDGAGITTAQFNTPNSITTDGANLYVGELNTGRIRKIEIATQNVTTIAGGGSVAGGTNCPGVVQATCLDGFGLRANFGQLNDLDYDNGYIYISDYSLARIRRLNLTTGQVETLAGNGDIASLDDTNGIQASFQNIGGAVVVNGNLYVLDINAHKVRRMSLTAPYGVTTIAGTGALGFTDGPASIARFSSPDNLTTDGRNLFIAEFGGNRIRRLDLTKNLVSTIAGSGVANDAAGVGIAANFNGPVGIVSDGARLYAASFNTSRIFVIADQALVGYWPLGQSARDYASDITTPSNLNSSASAPVLTTGRYSETNGAYNFTQASNQYFQQTVFSNLPLGTANSTMCAWVKPVSLPAAGAHAVIFGYGGTGSNNMRTLNVSNNSGQPAITFRTLGQTLSFPYAVAITAWTHICTTFSHVATGTQWVTVFVNGHNIGSQDTAPDINTTTGSIFRIGGPMISGDIYFDGAIADVRVYARVLNEGEINELAQDALSTNVGSGFNTGGTGLLSSYSFNPVSGVTTNTDHGALGYMLSTGTSPPSALGRDGDMAGAYFFSGTHYIASGVTAAGLPAGTHPRTMCAWVNPAGYPAAGAWMAIMVYGPNLANQQAGLSLYNNAGTTVANFETENGAFSIFGTTQIPLNTWSHVCTTIDANALAVLYVNGIAEASRTLSAINTAATTNLYLSTDAPPLQIHFNGKIDETQIYNNALSAMQIRQLAAIVPQGLMARYDMIDAPAGSISDVSGFGNTATATGAVAQVADRWQTSNQAYRFTPTQRVSSGTVATNAIDQVSLAAWVRMTGSTGALQVILSNGHTSLSGYTLYLDNSENIQLLCGGVSIASPSPAFKVPQLIWTHVAAVRNSTWTIYVNGVALPMGTNCIPNLPNSGAVHIGTNQDNAQGFRGDIDDARIYSKVLTPGEIKVLAGYHPMQVSSWNVNNASSSMRLHLNPESLINLNDNDPISQWDDSSGSFLHATQSTPADQPLYSSTGINGYPGVTFNSNRHFARGCNANLNSPATTLIGVMNQSDTSGGFRGIFHHGDKLLYFNGGIPQNLSYFQTGIDQVRAISQDNYITQMTASPNMIFAVAHNGGSGNIFKNGSDLTTSSTGMSPAFSCTTGLTIGKPAWVADNFNGKIGDFFYFNQSLSSSDRTTVECYLSSKYRIPLTGTICP